MALLICKRVHITVLNVSDMGCETVEKSSAVSWKVPDSLGMHSSGATEDLKSYADTAWELSLRYSGYHSSPKESEINASVNIYIYYILYIYFGFFWGGGWGEEWTVGGTRFIMGNAKVSNFRLTIGHFHDDDIWLQLREFISLLLSYLNLSILALICTRKQQTEGCKMTSYSCRRPKCNKRP